MIGNTDPVRPDEASIRALSGEAILDRATVKKIGGQRGIRELQTGGGSPSVVVVSPFKHLDRYNRTALRMPTALGSLRAARGARGY